MRIYQVEGDPDYIGIAHDSVDEVSPLLNTDYKHRTLDPAHVINIHYAFHESEEEGVVTDCPYTGLGSTLLLSQRACEALEPILDQAGVLLRVNPPHEMGYRMFVCYRHIDALDTIRTKHEEGFEGLITQFEFHAATLQGVDIFRLSNRVGRLFVSHRIVSEVFKHRLSGFRFKLLGSSETGGVALADSAMVFERFPLGYGTTLREKCPAMRSLIADGR